MATKSRTVAEIEAEGAGIRYVGYAFEGTERLIVGEGRRREMGRIMAATSGGWTATEILRVVEEEAERGST